MEIVKCSKNCFIFFLAQEAGTSKKNRKKLQKPHPRLKKKKKNQIFAKNIYSAWNPMQLVVFQKKCVNFVEQTLKFSHFEGCKISK